MIIIKAQGGIGNQMFQYALYRKFQRMGYEVSIDDSYYSIKSMHEGFVLNTVFKNLDININRKLPVFYKIFMRYGFIKKFYKKINRKIVNDFDLEKNMLEIFSNPDNKYFDGYWHNLIYYNDIFEIIKSDFQFDYSDPIIPNEILLNIKHTQSVGIHIRRGDYINNALYKDICTIDYYLKAIKYVSSIHTNSRFYFFSDDIEWCEHNFKNINNSTFIKSKKNKSYVDMILMSNCKSMIISNSTFSWWGAFLNLNNDAIIISPVKFNNKELKSKLVLENWITI